MHSVSHEDGAGRGSKSCQCRLSTSPEGESHYSHTETNWNHPGEQEEMGEGGGSVLRRRLKGAKNRWEEVSHLQTYFHAQISCFRDRDFSFGSNTFHIVQIDILDGRTEQRETGKWAEAGETREETGSVTHFPDQTNTFAISDFYRLVHHI